MLSYYSGKSCSELGIDDLSVVGIAVVLDVVFGNGNLQGMHRNVEALDYDVDILRSLLDQNIVMVLELSSQLRADPSFKDQQG